MSDRLRTDFGNIEDGDRLTLYPGRSNPIHKIPVDATFSGGFFFCDGTDTAEGPDYTMKDVSSFCVGFRYK